ncbi:hypothetical protein FACS1894139_15630 [Planctomycetales bacterium]|nr:hypothetical protein FACS1894108_11540 [Planctomycetales bacterium]GHT07386.1 hypothetical protein FACS1894139_15630 [Planctomycetales bacterium]GHV19833.1 hypothetical protein AGMMS49959_05860 [Planctomycetales bacterium]
MSTQLKYEVRKVSSPDGKDAMVAVVDGSIDPSTIDTFDAMFDDLLAADCKYAIIDCGELKYINSTGLGILVQSSDRLTENGGGLALMNVPPKISVILEMFGLEAFFAIVGTEAQALAALTGAGDAGGSTVQAHLDEGSEAAVGQHGGTYACGNCGADLIFTTTGDYVCPRCHALIRYDEHQRSTETAAASQTVALEIDIPGETAYFKHAGALVATHGMKSGLPTTAAKELIDNFAAILLKMKTACASPKRANATFRVLAFVNNKKLNVQLYTVGEQYSGDDFNGGQLGFDHAEITSLSSGTLLSLQKNLG